MPNGDLHNDYNEGQCHEKHEGIDRQFKQIEGRFSATDKRLDSIDSRLWRLVIIALVQVIGILALLLAAGFSP